MATILESEDVRVEFGPLVAVRDISFSLDGGDLLGLVGPNGAGKTTLLRVLAGLHAPTSGQARILGKPVLGEHEVVRHHVGFAPDAPPAYEELTIEHFLRFIGRAYELDRNLAEERIDFWLEQLWLTDKRSSLIKELSRGMRQRVTLARTFLPQPHVILLDEPLSGLDPAGRIELRRILGMLRNQGCAMILSSHILADLEDVATHIAIIAEGSVVRWDRSEDLHHDDEDRHRYRVTTLDGFDKHEKIFGAIDGVSNLKTIATTCEFEYAAGDDQAVALLRKLIEQNVPVVSFVIVRQSLEEVYLRAGVKQVD